MSFHLFQNRALLVLFFPISSSYSFFLASLLHSKHAQVSPIEKKKRLFTHGPLLFLFTARCLKSCLKLLPLICSSFSLQFDIFSLSGKAIIDSYFTKSNTPSNPYSTYPLPLRLLNTLPFYPLLFPIPLFSCSRTPVVSSWCSSWAVFLLSAT